MAPRTGTSIPAGNCPPGIRRRRPNAPYRGACGSYRTAAATTSHRRTAATGLAYRRWPRARDTAVARPGAVANTGAAAPCRGQLTEHSTSEHTTTSNGSASLNCSIVSPVTVTGTGAFAAADAGPGSQPRLGLHGDHLFDGFRIEGEVGADTRSDFQYPSGQARQILPAQRPNSLWPRGLTTTGQTRAKKGWFTGDRAQAVAFILELPLALWLLPGSVPAPTRRSPGGSRPGQPGRPPRVR